MAYTFRGGIHVNEYKLTDASPTEQLPTPPVVRISMNQSIGSGAVPVVTVGDRVLVGQVIGTVPEGTLGCPVHASVSGRVTEICDIRSSGGALEKTVVIESDGEERAQTFPFEGSIHDADRDAMRARIRECGITGMGGAAFPTYAKLNSAVGRCEYLIVNCAECEPFITADHRLLLESPEEVVGGVKILLRALSAPQAYIALEDNKKNAVPRLKKLCGKDGIVSVKLLKTKYPQGDERQLIYALTGRELPMGKLPADAGCVIFNAATCAAVYRAFVYGEPVVRRTVTVSGDCVAQPKNLSVPIGTPASYLIEQCGGLIREPKKMISGGPMMGQAQWDPDMPIKKGTSALLLLSSEFSDKTSAVPTCIRCGRCIINCPMRLMPAYIAQFVKLGDMKSAERYGAMSCVECGSCSYNCPAKVEIVQYIRVAKDHIRTEAARVKAAREASDEK